MVLQYYNNGDLRNYLNIKSESYALKILDLYGITNGLLVIHNARKVHKDLHSGNILFQIYPYISDLGMCQPANKEKSAKNEGVYGVLPYMAPEVLRGHQYTTAADIYSFGVIMNEYLSEETPHNDISHDYILAVKVCKGLRPKISDDTPKLLVDWIVKCWDANVDNRPTAKELYQILKKWTDELHKRFHKDGDLKNGKILAQIEECEKIRKNKKNRPGKNKPGNIQTHPQAIYTSRPLNYNNLPEPINSTKLGNV